MIIKDKILEVKNETEFEVKLIGVKIFVIKSGTESLNAISSTIEITNK